MPLSRTWYDDANYAASDTSTGQRLAQSILWGLKALLKGEITGTNGASGAPPTGSRWTCTGSSDGAAYGVNDNNDRWGATFDSTKLVRASGAVAHSWMVLKSPNALGPLYMLIDWNTSADSTVILQFSYNNFATGGSLTAAPTSTGSWVHSTDGSTSTELTFNDGSAAAHKLHRVTDADGNFWFLTSKNTQGIFQTLIGVQKLSETRAGDTKTVFSFYQNNAGGRGTGQLAAENANVNFFNTGNALNHTNPLVVGGRTFNDAALALGGVVAPYFVTNTNATGGLAAIEVAGARGFRGQANAADGKWDFFPLWVYTNNSTASGVRGRIPDVSAMIHSPTVGAGAPSAAAQERCVVGGLAIPFGVAPSL